MRNWSVVASIVLAACDPGAGDAPRRTRCTECEIHLERVGTLTDSIDPGALPDAMVYATRDRGGRVFTINSKKDGVLVYAANGTLIAKLGTPGNGPGEFRVIRRVLLGPNDSIYVADWGIGRITTFGPDLKMVRADATSHQPDLALGARTFVVAEQFLSRTQVAMPLHFVNDDRVVHSFGADSSALQRDAMLLMQRIVATAQNGDIWTVAPGRFVIERWNPVTAARTQTIHVKTDWFSETAMWPDDERAKPPAIIECLWADDGLLWVSVRDADVDWKPPQSANAERPLDADAYAQTYDWILIAIDSATGAVLATKRSSEILWARPPSNVVVTSREHDADGSVFDVWAPRLRQRAAQ